MDHTCDYGTERTRAKYQAIRYGCIDPVDHLVGSIFFWINPRLNIASGCTVEACGNFLG